MLGEAERARLQKALEDSISRTTPNAQAQFETHKPRASVRTRAVSEYIERWDRALGFLVEQGHVIGDTDGHSIIINGKSLLVRELPDLADRLNHDDWLTSGSAFVKSLLGPPD
jgi:hypothetical protein